MTAQATDATVTVGTLMTVMSPAQVKTIAVACMAALERHQDRAGLKDESWASELKHEAMQYAHNRTVAVTDRLATLGIPTDLCDELSLGITQAAIHDEGYWDYAEGGLTVVTIPIWSSDGAIDIIAVDPRDASKWSRRTDIATVVDPLEIDRAIHFEEPLHVYAT